MKRLVYAPQVNAWIKTETGIFDLSPYITDFSVQRRVDAISTASLTFRNPKVSNDPDGKSNPYFMFTQHPTSNADGTTSYRPMFYPMDPIIISLTRLKGYPVQVFTGYCDTTPYIQLFPGTAKISASCTLKRLKYTYWDPGLPFVSHYLETLGWKPAQASGGLTFNPSAEDEATSDLTDTSFGYLIYRILQDVGNWEYKDIYVQGLPSEAISTIVAGIYAQLTGDAKTNFEDVRQFLDKVIGTDTVGGAVATNPVNPNSPSTPNEPYNGKQGKLTPSEAKAYALSRLSNYGWGEDQWSDLETLWEHESNWRWNADNPTSDAYGIPQSLPGSKMATDGGGPDWETNAVTQINWGLNYIKQRYGSPKQAWAFWQSHNWY